MTSSQYLTNSSQSLQNLRAVLTQNSAGLTISLPLQGPSMGSTLFSTLSQMMKVRDCQRPLGPALDYNMTCAQARTLLGSEDITPGTISLVRRPDATGVSRYIGYVIHDYLDTSHVIDRDAPLGSIPGDFFDAITQEFGLVSRNAPESTHPLAFADIPPNPAANDYGEPELGKRWAFVVELMFAPVLPRDIVSADTTLMHFIRLASGRPLNDTFFVLDQSDLLGVIEYNDLFEHDHFRICLFALTLQLEELALKLCLRSPLDNWSALSPGRQVKAIEQYNRKRKQEHKRRGERLDWPEPEPIKTVTSESDALSCLTTTLFADKSDILRKRRLLSEHTKRAVSILSEAERIRNKCAHTEQFKVPMPHHEAWAFIADCHWLLSAFTRELENMPPSGDFAGE